jgi:serine/threonine protein kinase
MPPCEDAPEERHFEYNWIDGAEILEKYKPGGYHPIMIGDILHNRCHIVDKLGYGGYSTVWLAHDTCSKRYVAVKVGIADAPSHEIKILQALAQHHASSCEHPGRDAIPLPLDEFEISGPNGTHQCYTMPPAQCNLRDVSFCHLFPLEVTRALSYHLTLAIAYTHLQGYVHGGLSLHSLEFAS